ncbi:MAG: Asp-tRNA(Asn)/Glu-tRNA(Gln) amidotransferase subunit GatA [Phycisphaerales bacterium]|nr:Asp-tRNA(Asn)/Glu-tRNA(Gln) amidotransferase subunit GatA [Phycisphaerales bacterium]
MDYPAANVVQIAHEIRTKAVSAVDVARAALDRADALNPKLNALTQTFHEQALQRAREIDHAISQGQSPGPLAGVPIAIKDNICTTLGRTTCASRYLENYRSPFNAFVVDRLIASGANIIAKTNLDEFAMGGSGEHSCFGPTRNPWDLSRVPGGSSSGSAAAVSAGIVPAALGSDTGGSIRQPAALVGLTGLKPTYGRVSRYGLVAFASSLDQIGPMARDAESCAMLLSAIAGFDPRDSTCAQTPDEDFIELARTSHPMPLRIGIAREGRSDANHPAVSEALDNTVRTLTSLGIECVDVSLPHAGLGVAAYYVIAPAEASSNLARFDGVRYGRRAKLAPGEGLLDLYEKSRSEGFGPEVQRRIMLGTYALSSGYYDAYYNTALKVRRLIKQDYDAAFAQGCAAILMPTAPTPAFPIGQKSGDPLALYLEDIYTVGVNLAGLPAISFQAGLSEDSGVKLPVGMQLVGPALGEAQLLRLVGLFQSASSWHALTPRL